MTIFVIDSKKGFKYFQEKYLVKCSTHYEIIKNGEDKSRNFQTYRENYKKGMNIIPLVQFYTKLFLLIF